MILVLGATGTVGTHLVARLEARGIAVRAATRNPAPDRTGSAPRTLPGTPTERVLFDFERPETWPAALEGVDRVFLIARPGDDEADRCSVPLIDEMKRRGVRSVVNLTAMGADSEGLVPALRRIERHLEASGLGFTHLRPNFFMQIFCTGSLLVSIRDTGTISVPAAGAKLSFIDARDIAAVAEVALTDPAHAGKSYVLTGEAAIDHAQAAEQIQSAVGRPVRYVPIDESQASAMLARVGFAADRIERLMRFYRVVRSGACAAVSTSVADVLGKPAIGFAKFARDHAPLWR